MAQPLNLYSFFIRTLFAVRDCIRYLIYVDDDDVGGLVAFFVIQKHDVFLCTSTIWLEIEGVFRDRDSEWQQEFLRHLSLNDRFDFTYCFGIYTLYLM
jgi:hypothetical protein